MSTTFIYLIMWGVIIFILVVKAKKRSGAASDSKDTGNRQNTAGAQKRGPSGYPDMSGEARYFGTTSQPAAPSQPRPSAHVSAGKAAAPSAQEQKGMSTTDYLREKAAVDAAEHNRESEAELQRFFQESGGLPHGERILPGDSIPKGKRMVSCHYCGAENLLPVGSGQKTTCYFCREVL